MPALRARYLTYVHDIAERGLDWSRLGPVVAKYQALIEAAVQADTRKLSTFDDFTSGVGDAGGGENTLRGFVEARRKYLLNYREQK